MADPKKLRIAVAFMMSDAKRLLLHWNEKWQAFALPMSKPNAGPPAETFEQAAIRAAAEALLLPTRTVAERDSRATRSLQLSARDGHIKDYVYTVVPVEVHPDFRGLSPDSRPVIWMPIGKLLAGEYQPLTCSVKPILDECRAWGWL
jgi:hypothetical protein